MLRISRLTDYSTVVMAYLANNSEQSQPAKNIAQHTHIALPTVSKLLKLLTRTGLLVAQRGTKGGYSLAKPSEKISLAQIIQAMEGDIALTECGHAQGGSCAMEPLCAIRSNWRMITKMLSGVLNNISLAEMTKTITSTHLQQQFQTQYLKHKQSVQSHSAMGKARATAR